MALVVDIKKKTVYYHWFLKNIAYENAEEFFHK
jgi:hypothetical protein